MSRVLLVEDDEDHRDMLSRRLRRQGFDVFCAADGAQAGDRARAERPDLVLMDMHLPGVDGWEATRRLKGDPATRTIPVIALTADAMSGDREKALLAGCDDYETKPVDLPRLLEKMRALLERGCDDEQPPPLP
jgi:CheY-like chemotaxis protein